MALADWLLYLWVFALGAVVGSFLNVCIYRLPLEKSIIWPGSHCGNCFQPVRWYDNIPMVSYALLRGRCRKCGVTFSFRYFLIELLTALGFVGLFHFEVIENLHELDANVLGADRFLYGRLVLFGFHAVLLSFLIVATFCDLDHQMIPLPITIAGAITGLIGALLWPWPWPYTPAEAAVRNVFDWRLQPFVHGVYPWPVWGPLPAWLRPGGNWQTGLATGLAGAFAGTMMLRGIRFLFGFGRGGELTEPEDAETAQKSGLARAWSWLGRVGGRALGLGDADVMMMAGAFLGWQMTIVAFFVGVIPGLVMGLGQMAFRGNQPFAFGPALALGVILTWLGWPWIGPHVQMPFFDGTLMLIVGGMSCVFMLAAGYGIRLMRLVRS